ncbi:hypothetical protein JCM13304A_24930 [Desulfothermus okinawensis JCM 13304]
MVYPDNVKESVLKQILASSKTIADIARENGIPYTTVMTWKIKAQKGKAMNKKFTAEEKLNFLFQSASMNEMELSEFCRKKGIYPSTLDKWKQACLENIDIEAGKKFKKKEKQLKQKIHKLEREIRKKDKTIAETTALLVLKKKLEDILGDQEDAR